MGKGRKWNCQTSSGHVVKHQSKWPHKEGTLRAQTTHVHDYDVKKFISREVVACALNPSTREAEQTDKQLPEILS